MEKELVEKVIRQWLSDEKKDNYVDFIDLDEVVLDGNFSLSNLVDDLTL